MWELGTWVHMLPRPLELTPHRPALLEIALLEWEQPPFLHRSANFPSLSLTPLLC